MFDDPGNVPDWLLASMTTSVYVHVYGLLNGVVVGVGAWDMEFYIGRGSWMIVNEFDYVGDGDDTTMLS